MTKELHLGGVLILNEICQNHWLDEEREEGFSLLESISGGNL